MIMTGPAHHCRAFMTITVSPYLLAQATSLTQNANKTNATISKSWNVLFKLQNKQSSLLFDPKRHSQQLETPWISIPNSGKGRIICMMVAIKHKQYTQS